MQLAGLIEQQLDLDPTMDQHVLKSAYLQKSCLKSPHLKRAALKHFARHCFDDVIFNNVGVC